MRDYTVVFGDIVGSTSLRSGAIADSPASRLGSIAELVRVLHVAPLDSFEYSNTWGDAFVAVFTSAASAIQYTVDIRDRLRTHDWRSMGLIRPPTLRFAVDAGSLDWSQDDLRGSRVPAGLALVTAARIEAAAMPGDVWVTPTVKGLLRHAEADYFFEALGPIELSKKFGTLELFRVHRAEEKQAIEQQYLGPLQDDQHFHRADASRRFAMMWLVLDQLPRGSWGRSVEPWMREVWKDDPAILANPLMADEGGFETTILNRFSLCRVASPVLCVLSVPSAPLR